MTGPRMALTQHSSASVALVLLVLVLASMVAPAAPRQPRPRQAARKRRGCCRHMCCMEQFMQYA
jgi:hypothetical protein